MQSDGIYVSVGIVELFTFFTFYLFDAFLDRKTPFCKLGVLVRCLARMFELSPQTRKCHRFVRHNANDSIVCEI